MNPTGNTKILIVRLGALGDILHALPAQQHLAASCAGLSIQWLTESIYAPLLRCVPRLDRVWTVDTRSLRRNPLRLKKLLRLIGSLRREHFDVALDFQGLLKSALFARLSGAGRVLGFKPERFKEKGIQWLYDLSLPGESDLHRHVIELNLDLVHQLAPVSRVCGKVPFRLPREAEAYVDEALSRNGIDKPVLVNPGAGWVTKIWPPEQYGRLAAAIQKELGIPVVVTYGPGEEPLVEQVQAVAAPETLVAFPTTLVQLAVLCRRSMLMVAGDSGPLHLAVSLGTPTVAVIGPTSPHRNGPFDPEDEIVRRDLPCSHSYKRTCSQFICMDIPSEAVFEAVKNRLGKIGVGKKERVERGSQS